MNVKNKNYLTINTEKLFKAVKDSSISASKIATMVLNRDDSYLTTVKTRGTMIEEDLNKLCMFLSLRVEDVVVNEPEKKEEPKTVAPQSNHSVAQLETLIVGLNTMYEAQKLQNECLNNILEQMKVTNTKINRLENALGQIVTNSIQIKENTGDSRDLLRDIKSTGAIISGRLRDLIGKFK